ncbi:MAG: acetyl-CoA synthetase, partial [Methanobacteriaceae archaeon]|nr:acetyl-CoA synthetase [Methanobacteriaceae archaeon]
MGEGDKMSKNLDTLLKEERKFEADPDMIAQSNIKQWMDSHNIKNYEELIEKSNEDLEWFWNE